MIMIVLSERALDFAIKLNSILTTIKEYSDGELPVMARKNLEVIRNQLDQALKLVDEILGL